MTAKTSPKTIYVKPWNGCNLRCDFCYNAQLKNSTKMTDVILARTLDYIRQTAQESERPILVHLHGGEPMLYREDWLLAFCRSVRELGCNLTCTTNLTYTLTPTKREILGLMTPRFGKPFFQTSYDVGNTRFKTDNARRLFFENLTSLQGKGFNIQTTFCVTTEFIRGFYSTLESLFSNFGNFVNFERLTLNGNLLEHRSLIPSFEEVDEFFLRVWNEYVDCKKAGMDCHVPILDDLVFSVLNPTHWVGCRNRTCSSDVMTIEPDGSIGTCPNVSYKTIGLLQEKPVEFVYRQNELIRQEQQYKIDCLSCDVFNVCHGDCYQIQAQEQKTCHGLYHTIHAIKKDLDDPTLRDRFLLNGGF